MSYVPGCQYDLFISYASEDNADGWVERFSEALTAELGFRLGRHFTREFVYLDKTKLRVGQSFPKELRSAAQGSAVFVPLLSNYWLTSKWCSEERLAFFQRLPHEATNAECLAPLTVRPIKPEDLDDLFRDAERLDFFNSGTKEPPATGSDEWKSNVRVLADQIKDVLQALRSKYRPVFLGRAGHDTSEALRTRIADELGKRLFRVTPEHFTAFQDKARLTRHIREAALRVHFLGGMDEQTIEAVEASLEAPGGTTVLVRPFGLDMLTGDEQVWLDSFSEGSKSGTALQILENKHDQDVLEILDQEIARMAGPPREVNVAKGALGLVCVEPDFHVAQMLREEIEKRDSLKVQYPGFLMTTNRSIDRLRHWRELVRNSPALLFYWGEADPNKLERIWQLATEQRPDGRRCWYLTPPGVEGKRDRFPDSICQGEDFDYAKLDQFLAPLRPPAEGDK